MNRNWVWLSGKSNNINSYCCFRRSFTLKELPTHAHIKWSVNLDAIVYLNGMEIGRGQFTDYPDRKTFTSKDVTAELKVGKNVISVLAYNTGADFYAQIKAPGALWVELEDLVKTDEFWRARFHPALTSGIMPKVTPQLGFTMFCDLRKCDNWLDNDYDDSGWEFAEILSYSPSLEPRPLPPLPMNEFIAGKLIKSGVFRRQAEQESFALTVSQDEYFFDQQMTDSFDGIVEIYDLGSESVGYLEIECSGESGTIVDISLGEHLSDGVVRMSIWVRNFTDRIILHEGLNRFQLPFRRLGGRYLQLNAKIKNKNFKLKSIGLRDCSIKLPKKAEFISNLDYTSKIHDVALKTMHLCMHDHYEDCPWREQGLYAYDSRNQALFGYYAWGNYQFAKTSIQLLGRGIGEDGELNLCSPTNRTKVIPTFSMVWISELWEYSLYSGDKSLLYEFAEQVIFMTEMVYSRLDKQTGLLKLSTNENVWHFYEWTAGLDGMKGDDLQEHWSIYNLYALEMFRSASNILRCTGNAKQAEKLDAAAISLSVKIEEYFWNDADGHYMTTINGKKSHNHVQYLMLLLCSVPDSKRQRVLDSIFKGNLIKETLSPLPYMMRSLFEQNSLARAFTAQTIDAVIMKMLDSGATSLWETPDGENAFDSSGSLCHAWSCIHVYFYGAMVLGITPLDIGFRNFSVKPYAGNFEYASGEVPTPDGMIKVSWRKDDNNCLKLNLEHPSSLTPHIQSYDEFPVIVSEIKTYPVNDTACLLQGEQY